MSSAGKLNSCDIYLIKPYSSRYDTMVVLAVSDMKGFQHEKFPTFSRKHFNPQTVLTIETLSGFHEPINNKTPARVHVHCITATSFSSIAIIYSLIYLHDLFQNVERDYLGGINTRLKYCDNINHSNNRLKLIFDLRYLPRVRDIHFLYSAHRLDNQFQFIHRSQ